MLGPSSQLPPQAPLPQPQLDVAMGVQDEAEPWPQIAQPDPLQAPQESWLTC